MRLTVDTHSPHNDDVSTFEHGQWKRVVDWIRNRLEDPILGGEEPDSNAAPRDASGGEEVGQEHCGTGAMQPRDHRMRAIPLCWIQ